MKNILDEYYKKIGECLGKGYAECVYQEAICVHLRENGYTYSKESILPIVYKDVNIGNVRSDIIIGNKYIIECKAIDGHLKLNHIPQLVCYMNLTKIDNGMIVNFNQHPGKDLIEYIILTKRHSENDILATLNEKLYSISFNGILIREI